jgi:hypothetical protein
VTVSHHQTGRQSTYWKRDIRALLVRKFPKLLSAEELEPLFDFYAVCEEYLAPAMLRLTQFLNIEMREGLLTSHSTGLVRAFLADEMDSFEFITSDILHIGCRTKHLNVIDRADAYASMYQAKQMKRENKLNAAERLLTLSIAKLRQGEHDV